MSIKTKLGVDRTCTMALESMCENRYGDALRMLEYVVGTDPKNLPAFLKLAICYAALARGSEGSRISPEESINHIEEAISATEKALQLLQGEKELYQCL